MRERARERERERSEALERPDESPTRLFWAFLGGVTPGGGGVGDAILGLGTVGTPENCLWRALEM